MEQESQIIDCFKTRGLIILHYVEIKESDWKINAKPDFLMVTSEIDSHVFDFMITNDIENIYIR